MLCIINQVMSALLHAILPSLMYCMMIASWMMKEIMKQRLYSYKQVLFKVTTPVLWSGSKAFSVLIGTYI